MSTPAAWLCCSRAIVVAIALTVEARALRKTHRPATVFALGGAMHYAWVFTAYMLTSTITVPIYGKFADLYGRKPVMLLAIALFLAGSAASLPRADRRTRWRNSSSFAQSKAAQRARGWGHN